MMGHFKVDRAIIDHAVFAHPTALKIWIWCLAKASYKERTVPFLVGNGCTVIELKAGQFIFGRYTAEESLGIDGSAIYRWIQKFSTEEWGLLKLEPNNKYTIITICNWAKYQFILDENEQQENNKGTTDEQQVSSKRTASEHKQEGLKGKESIEGITKTWRDDFNVYLKDCIEAYKLWTHDKNFMSEQERLNPGVNVRLSIEKGYKNFWGMEAGWKFKKKKRTKDIDWRATIVSSIDINKVYLPREQQNQEQSKVATGF